MDCSQRMGNCPYLVLVYSSLYTRWKLILLKKNNISMGVTRVICWCNCFGVRVALDGISRVIRMQFLGLLVFDHTKHELGINDQRNYQKNGYKY